MKKKTYGTTWFSTSKKRIIILAILIIILAVFFIVLTLQDDKEVSEDIPIHDGDVLVASDEVVDRENNDAYLQELRASLEMDRNKIIGMLSETEKSASSSSEREAATKEKMRILGYMEDEKNIETLIKNKGIGEAFVVITDKGVNITVNSKELNQEVVTKITEIVMRETGCSATEIVIQDAS